MNDCVDYKYDYNDESILELIQSAKEKDEIAFEKLFEIFNPLVASIVKRYLNVGSYEDMMQAGRVGLVSAIQKFDQNKETKFSSYAYYIIKGEILKEVNSLSSFSMSSNFRRLSLKVVRVSNEIEGETGKKPSYEEIKKRLGNSPITVEEIQLALESMQTTLSLDSATNGCDKALGEMVSNENDSVQEDEPFDGKMSQYIETSGLIDKEQIIVKLKLGYNDMKKRYKTAEIANMLQLSESRIMQLYRRAIVKIKKHAEKDGYKVKHR